MYEKTTEFLADLTIKTRCLDLTYAEIAALTTTETESWRALRSFVEEEQRSEILAFSRKRFEALVRSRLISEFVDQYGTKDEGAEKEKAASRIDWYAREGESEALGLYVADIARLGCKAAEDNLKKEQQARGYFGHAWVAAVGIIRLALIIGIFRIPASRFETVVFALLILIHNAIDVRFDGFRIPWSVHALETRANFKQIRRLLREGASEFKREFQFDKERETDKEFKRSYIRFYINGVFLGLTWLIALWKLAEAILG